jgi:hypothetical protein
MTEAESPTDNRTYVAYSPQVESPRADEAELVQSIIAALRANNERAFKKYKHGIRDAHAKSHGILVGKLTVRPGLPGHLRQGIFATPTTYDVVARFSTTSGSRRSDQVRGVRGLGIKVLGVQGPRAVEGDDATTQDFVFVNEPRFPFKDALDYSKGGMRSARLLSYAPDAVMRVASAVLRGGQRALGLFGAQLPFKIALFAKPTTHTLGETFYTAAPLRYGKYVAKLSVAPLSQSVTELKGVKAGTGGDDAYRDAVVGFFRTNSAEYEVRAQLCTDLTRMPIEDATIEWPEGESPYQPVATITYPVQDAYSDERRDYGDDVLEFNSWRAIADHLPLGSINRLKKEVYEASSKFRHEKNGKARVEPSTITEVPD